MSAVVMHCTESDSCLEAVDWLCSPASGDSAHVAIDYDGTLYDMVPTSWIAYHAGVSMFKGATRVNEFSIGVELQNKGHGQEPYPEAQLVSAGWYIVGLMKVYPLITLDRITTHQAIALPMGRKQDPGPAFSLDSFICRVANYLNQSQGGARVA